MKLVIVIQKKLALHGHVVRKFRFDVGLGLHIYEGRQLEVEEFNRISKDVFHQNESLHPYALVVGAGAGAEVPAGLVAEVAQLKAENQRLVEERNSLMASLSPPADVSFSAAAPVAKVKKGKS